MSTSPKIVQKVKTIELTSIATQSVSVDCEDSRSNSPARHASHQQHIKTSVFSKVLPAEPGLQQIDESWVHTLDVSQAHRIINDAFVKHLQEIEQKAPNVPAAQLGTYKNWVSVLQHLNKELLNDFDELEKTIEQHLSTHASHSNLAYRRDLASLVKFIRQVYHEKNWDLDAFKFETITPAEILGQNENEPPPDGGEVLSDLLHENEADALKKDLTALADEVTGSRDEIDRLKREICCLMEEIKKAEEKIQFKDECISKLENDRAQKSDDDVRVQLPCKCCCQMEMAPLNMENFAGALQKEIDKADVHEKVLLDLSSFWQNKSSIVEISRISDFLMKLQLERSEACKRVDNLRAELLKILVSHSTDKQELSMQLTDDKLLHCICERFECIYGVQKELREENVKLIKEKAEINDELIFLKKEKISNDAALRELSDLLTSMTGEVCGYEAIDGDPVVNSNPFCKAICQMKVQESAKIGELKAQLQREIEKRALIEDELSKLKYVEENSKVTTQPENTQSPT